MTKIRHWAVFISNASNKVDFIERLLNGAPQKGFESLKGKTGALFSKLTVDRFIEEEIRHDHKVITRDTTQSLHTMSSGERKKALLRHLLNSSPDFIILDNPFDNLDTGSQEELRDRLALMASDTQVVQLISRSRDLLPFITHYGRLEGKTLLRYNKREEVTVRAAHQSFNMAIPEPITTMTFEEEFLVRLHDVSVQYGDTPILKNIDWAIRPGEFWQLVGKNGSGKTTLLSMITGDNPKGYGQELYLFGRLKGSGESIWDIKKMIGYFTPAMIDRFSGYHTLENMLISGLMDSIGLYVQPTERQIRLAGEWLTLTDMWEHRDRHFHDLSMGQQRLIMCVRSMIKHPLLLILDEPTSGLDDESAELFVALINKIALESSTAIIFVSHREETGLQAPLIYELLSTENGSIGRRSDRK
ncbi:MAG TPA: ATP-binding cassette domain-containing protein [Eudoraea sp.]|nr:ATP-binding cassette domain-containing protein [Eudoraea sp.]